MNPEIKKEILYDLERAIEILQTHEKKDVEELKVLSDHAIEHVAMYKDLDVISITVLVYSIYKTFPCITGDDYLNLVRELQNALGHLRRNNLGKYNHSIKKLYEIVNRCSSLTKEHLQEVMQAARIKKGTALLSKGLSIGQAAGLMGLSNWDLQQYAAKTTALESTQGKITAVQRVRSALEVFGLQ